MDQPQNLEELVEKYLNGSASEEEKALLNRWYRQGRVDQYTWFAERPDEEDRLKAEILQNINEHILPARHQSRKWRWSSFAVAASIVLLSSGIYILYSKRQPNTVAVTKTDAFPGSNGAILTLADGKQLTLGKNIKKQNLQPANHIGKLSDSTLIYDNRGQSAAEAIAYNTLTTPNGKQFNVVLPDGTKVWMNAGSRLEYPVTFTGKERLVKLSGEAYFEVVHNEKSPFRVLVNGQNVNDIGTAFNINAYHDEKATIVTLVEGSASVTNQSEHELLHPGQQAAVTAASNNIIVSRADMETALAWKNGLFHFDHVSLDVALRQIARWYDLQIVYEGDVPDITIDGEIYRDVKASQLFAILGKLNVKFRIEDNKLIVVQQKPQ